MKTSGHIYCNTSTGAHQRYERNRPHSKTICGKPNEKNASSSNRLSNEQKNESKKERKKSSGNQRPMKESDEGKGKNENKIADTHTLMRSVSERAPYLIACAVVVLVFISTYFVLMLQPSFTPLRRKKVRGAHRDEGKNVEKRSAVRKVEREGFTSIHDTSSLSNRTNDDDNSLSLIEVLSPWQMGKK